MECAIFHFFLNAKITSQTITSAKTVVTVTPLKWNCKTLCMEWNNVQIFKNAKTSNIHKCKKSNRLSRFNLVQSFTEILNINTETPPILQVLKEVKSAVTVDWPNSYNDYSVVGFFLWISESSSCLKQQHPENSKQFIMLKSLSHLILISHEGNAKRFNLRMLGFKLIWYFPFPLRYIWFFKCIFSAS